MDGGESERWLGIAAKLLTARDFLGSRTFAIRAKESDPNNSVSDQILAVVDTVLSGEKRVETTQQPDWYGVLQLPKLVRDGDLITNHYRRLVTLLSPERNRLPFVDYALQLVMDAWSVLSDPTKKWLFDNELALSLQNSGGAAGGGSSRVDVVRVDPSSVAIGGDPGGGGVGSGSGSGSGQVNTFEFFQPVPAQPPPPQQQTRTQPHMGGNLQMWQQQQPAPPQVVQREFIPAPAPQMPAQWQLRDLNPNPNPSPNHNANVNPSPNPKATMEPAPASWVARSGGVQVRVPPAPAPASAPVPPVVTATQDGNENVGGGVDCDNNNNNNNCNGVVGNVGGNNVNVDGNKRNYEGGEGGEEEVESFWTACPYCLYIYEYQKKYQDCTLRCQNCRRGFHALPVPNAPPVGPGNGGKGKGKGGGKEEKENSFCCWGFFPLGFSMAAWKKHNRNGSGNWVPFSPMFASPRGNGGGNFHWFANDGNGNENGTPVGGGRSAYASAPRIYIDDDDVFDVSDSGGDSSDRDWRNPGKRKNKGKIGGGKRGRGIPKKADKFNQEIQNLVGEGVVTVAGDMENGLVSHQVVVGLVAGKKTDTNKTEASTVTRKQTRRNMKDRLDLNVEFNNEGDEHAPTVSAVNRDEDGIENIGFFEGLDEFLSTLPILNVGGDEKAKPS